MFIKFYVKVFYVMGKALSGELSCPCDRSCFPCCFGMELNKLTESYLCDIMLVYIFFRRGSVVAVLKLDFSSNEVVIANQVGTLLI